MQLDVRLTGPGAPVFGARGILAVPFPPAGAAQVIVVRVGVAVRQVVEGSGQVGRDADDVSEVLQTVRNEYVVL